MMLCYVGPVCSFRMRQLSHALTVSVGHTFIILAERPALGITRQILLVFVTCCPHEIFMHGKVRAHFAFVLAKL